MADPEPEHDGIEGPVRLPLEEIGLDVRHRIGSCSDPATVELDYLRRCIDGGEVPDAVDELLGPDACAGGEFEHVGAVQR